jgi:hypothetical protein
MKPPQNITFLSHQHWCHRNCTSFAAADLHFEASPELNSGMRNQARDAVRDVKVVANLLCLRRVR